MGTPEWLKRQILQDLDQFSQDRVMSQEHSHPADKRAFGYFLTEKYKKS